MESDSGDTLLSLSISVDNMKFAYIRKETRRTPSLMDNVSGHLGDNQVSNKGLRVQFRFE